MNKMKILDKDNDRNIIIVSDNELIKFENLVKGDCMVISGYKQESENCCEKYSFVRVLPRDYLQYGKESNTEQVVNAILNHLGEAKIYF